MTIPAGVEQDSCQILECIRTPVTWCWAFGQFLCEDCRRARTDNELKDGGRHPVSGFCSCENCRVARMPTAEFLVSQVSTPTTIWLPL